MSDCPSELLELGDFLAMSEARRSALAHELVELLGPEWSTTAAVGANRLCALTYEPLELCFVVVPGGRFEMGFRDHDRDALAPYVDVDENADARATLDMMMKHCRPVHEVHVSPHLFSRDLLAWEQLTKIDPKFASEEVLLPQARKLAAATPFRLPSEAEYEWVAREGGTASFTSNLAAQYDGGYFDPRDAQSGFGIRELLTSQWMEDDWHDNYEDAPATSAAWHVTDAPEKKRRKNKGVCRGAVDTAIERPFDMLFALAANRWGGDLLKLRLARSL